MNYAHYGDECVDLAIALINEFGTDPRAAAGHSDDPLPDLSAFLEAHGFDADEASADDRFDAQRLADKLHAVFVADDPTRAVSTLNEVLVASAALPQISGHDDEDWHMHYYPSGAAPLDRLAVTAAMGLAAVLCTAGIRRLGHCSAPDCRDVYVDTSRNNRRRFCSDGCANLTHVAAFRARQRSEQA